MNYDPKLHTTDPGEYKEQEFGKVVPFEVVKVNREAFSEIFSEGSPALKKLLNKLWENDIKTIGCCVGHKDQEYFYKTNDKGKIEFIEKKEYNWHRFSKHYHRVKEDATAYFALDPRSVKSAKELGNELIEYLYDKNLPYEFTVGCQENMVTVYLDRFVERDTRENFFDLLSESLDKHLIQEKNKQQTQVKENKKELLTEQISAAKYKAEKNNTETQKTRNLKDSHEFSR